MIEHGTVKSVDSLPSATPANRHTSGIIIYPAPEQKKEHCKIEGKFIHYKKSAKKCAI